MIPKYGGGGENRTLKKTLQGFQFPVSLRPHKILVLEVGFAPTKVSRLITSQFHLSTLVLQRYNNSI